MVVLLNAKQGVPLEDFLERNDVSGKNVVYIVGNRIPSDRNRRKIGKSLNGLSRLGAYVRAYGVKRRVDNAAGSILYYVETVPPKPEHKQGPPLVEIKEKFVKDRFAKNRVPGRGTEWIEARHEAIVNAFANAPQTMTYADKRESSRVTICPEVCRPRKDGATIRVEEGGVKKIIVLHGRK